MQTQVKGVSHNNDAEYKVPSDSKRAATYWRRQARKLDKVADKMEADALKEAQQLVADATRKAEALLAERRSAVEGVRRGAAFLRGDTPE